VESGRIDIEGSAAFDNVEGTFIHNLVLDGELWLRGNGILKVSNNFEWTGGMVKVKKKKKKKEKKK